MCLTNPALNVRIGKLSQLVFLANNDNHSNSYKHNGHHKMIESKHGKLIGAPQPSEANATKRQRSIGLLSS